MSIGHRRRRRDQRKHNKKVGGMGHKWWIFGAGVYSSYWGFKGNRENLRKWTFTSKSNCSWLTCWFNCRIERWKRRILLFWIRICWFQGKQKSNFYKGQLNSEWIHEVIVSPKMPTKNFPDFCPERVGQKSGKILVGILGETMTS